MKYALLSAADGYPLCCCVSFIISYQPALSSGFQESPQESLPFGVNESMVEKHSHHAESQFFFFRISYPIVCIFQFGVCI